MNLEQHVTQVYSIMKNVKNELTTRIGDQFFGFTVNQNFKNVSEIASFKKEAINMYMRALHYLNKWFSFENNLLKKFNIFSLDAVFLFHNLVDLVNICKIEVDGDELCREYCVQNMLWI